jgi:hypothetical protein
MPATRLNPDLPAELDRIITKCLEKDRNLRYQHASDVRTDLQRLKRDTDSARVSINVTAPAATGIGRRWKLIVPAAVAVLASSVGSYFYFHRTPKLTDKDTIVMADFTNTTGDPVFDGSLKQPLAIQLEQSPFLNVFPEQRLRETLSYMGRPSDERITSSVAREICQREGVRALLTGSIASLGTHYVISLNAETCDTWESLAREQAEAGAKEDVLEALGKVASHLRSRLGESLSSIQRFDTPLGQATTSSLEALKSFTLGEAQRAKGMEAAAIPFYQRAIELDSNFALAYARLSIIYGNLGRRSLQVGTDQKYSH